MEKKKTVLQEERPYPLPGGEKLNGMGKGEKKEEFSVRKKKGGKKIIFFSPEEEKEGSRR